MYCKNCGNKIDEGTKFCPNCGAQQEVNQEQTNEVADVEYKSTEDFNQDDNYTLNDKPIENGIEEHTNVVSAMVGKNSKYFIQSFDRIKEGKSGKFNVAAFFLTGVYALYRKMYNYFYLPFIPLVISIISAFVLIFSLMTLQLGGIATYIGLNVISFIAMIVISITMGVKFNKSYYEKITKDINNKSITLYSIENDQNVKEFVQKNYGTSIKNVCIYFTVIIGIMTVIYSVVNKYEGEEYDAAYEIVEDVEKEGNADGSISNAIRIPSHIEDTKSDFAKKAPIEKEKITTTPSQSNGIIGKFDPNDTKFVIENENLIYDKIENKDRFFCIGDVFTDNELFNGCLYDYMICHSEDGDTYLRFILRIEPYHDMHMSDSKLKFDVVTLDGESLEYISTLNTDCQYGAMYDNTGDYLDQSDIVNWLAYLGAYNENGSSFISYDYNITNLPKDTYFSPAMVDVESNYAVGLFSCFQIY